MDLEVQENNNFESKVYKVQDIMKLLDIGKNSAYNLIKSKKFPVITIGSSIRVPKESFNQWIIQLHNETQ